MPLLALAVVAAGAFGVKWMLERWSTQGTTVWGGVSTSTWAIGLGLLGTFMLTSIFPLAAPIGLALAAGGLWSKVQQERAMSEMPALPGSASAPQILAN